LEKLFQEVRRIDGYHSPLVPGESAAGIILGSSIETVIKPGTLFQAEEIRSSFVIYPFPVIRYCSAMVDVWTKAGIITQIMVHDGYAGKLFNVIGLGSTIADIERFIGPCEEDEEDNLIVRDLPGFCFEVEGWFPNLRDPAFHQARIKEMYVFKEIGSL
jgi:hypothetical protein